MEKWDKQNINGLDPPSSKINSSEAVIDLSQVAHPTSTNDIFGEDSSSQDEQVENTRLHGKKKKVTIYPIRVHAYGILASWMSLAFGYCVGLISATLLYIPLISQVESVLVVTTTLFGALVGAISTNWLSEALGRRPLLIANYSFAIISSIGCALANFPWHLMIWRFILGFGVGIASVIPSIYISELAPVSLKARFSVMNQMAGSLGIAGGLFVSAILGAAFGSGDMAAIIWRWMFASGVFLATVGMISTAVAIPESPRWLILRNKKTEARQILDQMYSPLNAEESSLEFRTMCDYALSVQVQGKDEITRWRDLGRRRNLRSLSITLVLPAFQQLGGAAAFIYFPAIIFATVGVEKAQAILYAALASIPQVFSFLALMMKMEKVGKRNVLMVSLFGCSICLAALGGVFFAYLRPKYDVSTASYLIFDKYASLMVFFAFLGARVFHAIGLGPIPQILIPELVPFAQRGRVASLSSAIYWLLNLIIAGAFLPSLKSFAPYVIFWLFAGFMLFGLLLVWLFVKQVQGKAMEEIERVHQLPVVAPGGENRDQLPKDSTIAQLRTVIVPLEPSLPLHPSFSPR